MEETININPSEQIEEIKQSRIKFYECYKNSIDKLKFYCDLKPSYYSIVSLWNLGTYFHDSFPTYCYLFFNAMKGSGKSRLLKLIAFLSKNGEVLNSLTEAVLFRERGTLCIDEFESITKQGKESLRELLNSAYKQGTKVKRMRKVKSATGEKQEIEKFENKFLSALLNKYHSEIIKRNYKVTKFKLLDWEGQIGEWEFCRDRFRGGIFVLGFFEPIMKWHGVTLYPHKRKETDIKQRLILSLRQKWSETAKKRDFKDRCEICGGNYPQLHHDSESFKKIVEECLTYFTQDELKNGIGEDWWLHESEADALPNNHPAVLKLHELHSFVKYKWLCYDCHKKTFKGVEEDGNTKTN